MSCCSTVKAKFQSRAAFSWSVHLKNYRAAPYRGEACESCEATFSTKNLYYISYSFCSLCNYHLRSPRSVNGHSTGARFLDKLLEDTHIVKMSSLFVLQHAYKRWCAYKYCRRRRIVRVVIALYLSGQIALACTEERPSKHTHLVPDPLSRSSYNTSTLCRIGASGDIQWNYLY